MKNTCLDPLSFYDITPKMYIIFNAIVKTVNNYYIKYV